MIRSLRLWLAEVREISSTSTLRDDSFSKSKQTVRARKWAQRLSRGLSVRTIPDSPYSTWSYGHMMLSPGQPQKPPSNVLQGTPIHIRNGDAKGGMDHVCEQVATL